MPWWQHNKHCRGYYYHYYSISMVLTLSQCGSLVAIHTSRSLHGNRHQTHPCPSPWTLYSSPPHPYHSCSHHRHIPSFTLMNMDRKHNILMSTTWDINKRLVLVHLESKTTTFTVHSRQKKEDVNSSSLSLPDNTNQRWLTLHFTIELPSYYHRRKFD